MARIVIKKYKMFEEIDLDLDKSAIIIGKQASGKSTLARLVYFFRSISNELQSARSSTAWQPSKTDRSDRLKEAFEPKIKEQFFDLFGSLRDEHPNSSITYYSDEDYYIRFEKNPTNNHISLKVFPEDLYENLISERLRPGESFIDYINRDTGDLFRLSRDTVYLPASRDLTVQHLDMFNSYFRRQGLKQKNIQMQILIDFVDHVDSMKTVFKKSNNFPDLMRDTIERRQIRGDISPEEVKVMEYSVEKTIQILRAKYQYTSSSERLIFDEERGKSVTLADASSGQQEAVRIVQDIVVSIMKHQSNFRIYEEPEAHLFPTAQKHLLELIATMLKATKSVAIITTHSPYLLTVLNNLLYAHKVANSGNVNGAMARDGVPHPSTWLSPDQIQVYLLEDGTLTPLITERGLIGDNALDGAFDTIGDEFETILDIQYEAIE